MQLKFQKYTHRDQLWCEMEQAIRLRTSLRAGREIALVKSLRPIRCNSSLKAYFSVCTPELRLQAVVRLEVNGSLHKKF